MASEERQRAHQKIKFVEEILTELPLRIKDPKDRIFHSDHPIFFIVGCARSGTTLLYQYLSSTGHFAYPSNFLSRFFYAPYTGSLLQKLMTELDDRGELFGTDEKPFDFQSLLGKTKGAFAPNEFWYYWRRFFHFDDIQRIDEEELDRVDWSGFLNGLKGIQEVQDKPLILKGMILNWNLARLVKEVPNSYFLFIQRDMKFNAQSLIRAREEFFGDRTKWYSFKPPEYDKLKEKNVFSQVAGQVHYTNKAIELGLEKVEESRIFRLNYEAFSLNPNDLLREINQKTGINLKAPKSKMNNNNSINLNQKEWEILSSECEKYG